MGRPPGPTLNQDKVVRAARQLAETEISRLDVTPMALYRHVRNKQDLLALVLDDVLSEVGVPGPDSGGWAERLRVFHADVMGALDRLPGIADHFYELPQTPNSSRLLAGYLEILLESGISEHDAILAYTTLYYLAVGSLYRDTVRRSSARRPSPAADPPNYPAPILDRVRAQAINVGASELREYGVEAVITFVGIQAATRVDRPKAAVNLRQTRRSAGPPARRSGTGGGTRH
jgi:AcrR family transcriptional regulator